MSNREEIHNFAAGPSPLPTPVLKKAAEGLLDYNGCGMGVSEISHRSKEFKGIIEGAEANLRSLSQIPDNYAVLFTQGGGTGQFSSTILNILAYYRLSNPNATEPPTLDYVVTGAWSSKAHSEAIRLCTLDPSTQYAKPNIAATTKPSKWTTLPSREDYKFTPGAAMVCYCENETINGVQFPTRESPYAFPFDLVPEGVPIVADYSSSFLSRPIPNIEKHAIIYAGAQKNLGPAGVTVVIVRKDLLVDTAEAAKLGGIIPVPIESEYKVLADNGSLYNTPPTFTIYVCALVLDRLVELGGLVALGKINAEKAKTLYEALDEAEEKGKVKCVVRNKDARSWMNVTFEVEGEKEWLVGAEKKGFRQLKGHRSVGGIRASLYNAVELDSVRLLSEYVRQQL